MRSSLSQRGQSAEAARRCSGGSAERRKCSGHSGNVHRKPGKAYRISRCQYRAVYRRDQQVQRGYTGGSRRDSAMVQREWSSRRFIRCLGQRRSRSGGSGAGSCQNVYKTPKIGTALLISICPRKKRSKRSFGRFTAGRSVIFSDQAKAQLEEFKQGLVGIFCRYAWRKLGPLTDDAKIVGRPTGFDIHVQELRISAGAGFVVVLTGNIMTMPGLPKDPAALHMGINEKGISYGIF